MARCYNPIPFEARPGSRSSALSFRRPCKRRYPSRGFGTHPRRNPLANLVLALLAFGLVSSVGAGVALHQIGSQPLVVPHNGEACGHDHNETNDPDETAERNE